MPYRPSGSPSKPCGKLLLVNNRWKPSSTSAFWMRLTASGSSLCGSSRTGRPPAAASSRRVLPPRVLELSGMISLVGDLAMMFDLAASNFNTVGRGGLLCQTPGDAPPAPLAVAIKPLREKPDGQRQSAGIDLDLVGIPSAAVARWL